MVQDLSYLNGCLGLDINKITVRRSQGSVWTLYFKDGERITLDANHLDNQSKFRTRIISAGFAVPWPVKAREWHSITEAIVASAIPETKGEQNHDQT